MNVENPYSLLKRDEVEAEYIFQRKIHLDSCSILYLLYYSKVIIGVASKIGGGRKF